MRKKKVDPPTSTPASTHVGLLQKTAAAGTSTKWSSLGELPMKRQPNLFGGSSLKLLNEYESFFDGHDNIEVMNLPEPRVPYSETV